MRWIVPFALAVAACNSSDATEQKKPPRHAPLVELDSLDAVRREFDAHQGEPRFLALLSPT